MGNNCKNCLQLDQIDNFEKIIFLKNRIVPEENDISHHDISHLIQMMHTESADSQTLIHSLTTKHITELFDAMKKNLENQEKLLSEKKTQIFNKKLNLFDVVLEINAKFVPQQNSSNNTHHYFFQLKNFPFTPKLYTLFVINQNLESQKKCNKQLDTAQLIEEGFISNNVYAYIAKETTIKSMFNSSKSFLTLRLYSIKDNDIQILQTSLKNTELFKCKQVQILDQEIEEQMLYSMNSLVFDKNQNDGQIIKCAIELDPLNQVGLLLAKGFMNKNFKDFYNEFMDELVIFIIDKAKNKNFDSLKWFGSKQEIKQIIEENYSIIENTKFKLPQKYLDKMAEVSQINSDLLISSQSSEIKESKKIEIQDFLQQSMNSSENTPFLQEEIQSKNGQESQDEKIHKFYTKTEEQQDQQILDINQNIPEKEINKSETFKTFEQQFTENLNDQQRQSITELIEDFQSFENQNIIEVENDLFDDQHKMNVKEDFVILPEQSKEDQQKTNFKKNQQTQEDLNDNSSNDNFKDLTEVSELIENIAVNSLENSYEDCILQLLPKCETDEELVSTYIEELIEKSLAKQFKSNMKLKSEREVIKGKNQDIQHNQQQNNQTLSPPLLGFAFVFIQFSICSNQFGQG